MLLLFNTCIFFILLLWAIFCFRSVHNVSASVWNRTRFRVNPLPVLFFLLGSLGDSWINYSFRIYISFLRFLIFRFFIRNFISFEIINHKHIYKMCLKFCKFFNFLANFKKSSKLENCLWFYTFEHAKLRSVYWCLFASSQFWNKYLTFFPHCWGFSICIIHFPLENFLRLILLFYSPPPLFAYCISPL